MVLNDAVCGHIEMLGCSSSSPDYCDELMNFLLKKV